VHDTQTEPVVDALEHPRHATVHDRSRTPRKCEEYCEREVDEVEVQGDRVYLHLGVRRDDAQRR
jgi:hypothetical protein